MKLIYFLTFLTLLAGCVSAPKDNALSKPERKLPEMNIPELKKPEIEKPVIVDPFINQAKKQKEKSVS